MKFELFGYVITVFSVEKKEKNWILGIDGDIIPTDTYKPILKVKVSQKLKPYQENGFSNKIPLIRIVRDIAITESGTRMGLKYAKELI